MKKIIKGSVFDTTTAKHLGGYSYLKPGDFSYFSENLYKTRSGKYFIHGVGGSASIYAEQVSQNEWEAGETIFAVSLERAKEWAEENLDCDLYIEIFGAPSEVEQKIMTFSLDTNVESLLRAEQEKTGKNLSDIVSKLVVNNFEIASRRENRLEF